MNDSKPKGKCFHYEGNQKMNCPNYLAQKMDSGVIESLVIEVSFIEGTLNSWCVDFSITNHICNTLQEFQKLKKLSDGEVTLYLGLEVRVAEVFVVVVKLFFSSNKTLILYDYLFVPSNKRNLI